MPNPATVTDVAARFWRPLTGHEETVAYTRHEDAWWLLTSKRKTLEADIVAGTVSEGNVRRVIADMVCRILNNPQAKAEEAIDDYRYRRDSLIASGALMVTPEELVDVTPATTGSSHRSVRLVVHGDR